MKPRRRFGFLSTAARALTGFLLGVVFWFAFSAPYERLLAAAGEALLRSTERPPVTRLSARNGEILVERSDFPPAASRPGLPAADLHFNLALLAALFALDRRPWQADRVGAFLGGCVLLFAVHVAALVFDVRSVYATGLGAWSAAHYGVLERNLWSGGFHFYQIAGRFAAPFAIWWLLRRADEPAGDALSRRKGGSRKD
jgi:hypothetical protein